MSMAVINGGNPFFFDGEICLSELLRKYGVLISLPCGGKATCGKCKVTAKGSLSPLSEKEKNLLTEEEIKEGIRLACVAKATGDVSITAKELPPVVEIDFSLENSDISFDFTDGLVIDIGTTTVAAIVYQNKMPVKIMTEPNYQCSYGADIITRIAAEKDHPGALYRLLNHQIEAIVSSFGTPKNTVIVANTTLLHFLTGQPVEQLGKAPYVCKDLFGKEYSLFQTTCYLTPCISAFVGGDITAGILATRMTESSRKSMLVDLGTNGEIAYWDGASLHAASTAAGPAFEGAGIFMGMPAKPGAVNHVSYQNGVIRYTTVGNTKALGICGSGIIDALAVMKKTGVLEESGALCNEHSLCSLDFHGKPCFRIPGTEVILRQEDIRKLQLAKSAIHAGMLTLANEVDTLYFSGGFGSGIDFRNAELIGLLPKNFAKEVKILGNTALFGGTLALFSKANREKLSQIATGCKTIPLHQNPEFTNRYIEAMSF